MSTLQSPVRFLRVFQFLMFQLCNFDIISTKSIKLRFS